MVTVRELICPAANVTRDGDVVTWHPLGTPVTEVVKLVVTETRLCIWYSRTYWVTANHDNLWIRRWHVVVDAFKWSQSDLIINEVHIIKTNESCGIWNVSKPCAWKSHAVNLGESNRRTCRRERRQRNYKLSPSSECQWHRQWEIVLTRRCVRILRN